MPRAKLTDKFLQSSKRIVPAAGQTDYWDQLTPGFGVEGLAMVAGSLSKCWRASMASNATVHPWRLSAALSACRSSRDQAERMLKDAAKGISPKDRELEERHKAQATTPRLFRQGRSRVHGTRHAKGVAHSRRDGSECSIGSCCQPWSDRPIASITRAEVKALLRAKAQVAPIAANRLASLISKLFNWGVGRGDRNSIAGRPAGKRTEEHGARALPE